MGHKKVIYIQDDLGWFFSHRLALAIAAQKSDWYVGLAIYGADQDDRMHKHGFAAHGLPNPGKKLSVFRALDVARAVKRIVRAENPTIVHIIGLKYAVICGAVLRFQKRKLVMTLAGLGFLFSDQGWKPRIMRAVLGPVLRFALKNPRAQIIFQNPDDMAMMTRGHFVREENCHLIRSSGVDLEAFQPRDEAKVDSPPLVVMATRLIHDKGVKEFIEAARLIKSRGSEAQFVLAGGITTHNPNAITHDEITAMVVDGTVQWLGRVDDMPGLFARSTLVVYPSYYREGVPKVLLEAAAMAKPIVTTDHPGCREVVQDGVNGFLVPVRDPIKTADAVERILTDSDLAENMGQQSREIAKAQFDVHKIVAQTLKVYEAASL